MFYLGREYYFNQMFNEAKEMFDRYLGIASWGAERAAAYRYLAKCDVKSTESNLIKALQEGPRRETLVDLATYYYETLQWDKCKHYATEAIKIEEKPLDYLCEAYAWSEVAYDLSAIASYHLGEYESAVEYGAIAASKNESNERLQNNLRFYKEKLNGNT